MQFSYQLIILLFCSMSVLVEGSKSTSTMGRRNLDRILDSSGYDYSSSKTPSCANVNYDMACIVIWHNLTETIISFTNKIPMLPL